MMKASVSISRALQHPERKSAAPSTRGRKRILPAGSPALALAPRRPFARIPFGGRWACSASRAGAARTGDPPLHQVNAEEPQGEDFLHQDGHGGPDPVY